MKAREGRFFAKVVESGDCWNWTACRNALGYGKFGAGGRTMAAHRWSYEFFRGPIPDGLTLDHLCRNPSCVNPDHLEPVTNAENARRQHAALGARRGPRRATCSKGHPMSGDNLAIYVGKYTQYQCRICQKARGAARSIENSAAIAAHEACGHVSKYGRSCRRDVGHGGRHQGAARRADELRDQWHYLGRLMQRRSA